MLKEYTFDIFYEPMEEGGYLVIVPALPGIVTYGKDLEEARFMALDAIKCHCEGLLKDGEPIPDNSNMKLEPQIEKIRVSLAS
jgi:antitoxin HicB